MYSYIWGWKYKTFWFIQLEHSRVVLFFYLSQLKKLILYASAPIFLAVVLTRHSLITIYPLNV